MYAHFTKLTIHIYVDVIREAMCWTLDRGQTLLRSAISAVVLPAVSARKLAPGLYAQAQSCRCCSVPSSKCINIISCTMCVYVCRLTAHAALILCDYFAVTLLITCEILCNVCMCVGVDKHVAALNAPLHIICHPQTASPPPGIYV